MRRALTWIAALCALSVLLAALAIGGAYAWLRATVPSISGSLMFDGLSAPGWVFLGDPLSTAVNARGEPADTGESRAVTFDSINSNGHPSYILNAVQLALFAGLGDDLQLNAAIDSPPSSVGGIVAKPMADAFSYFAKMRSKSAASCSLDGPFGTLLPWAITSRGSRTSMSMCT